MLVTLSVVLMIGSVIAVLAHAYYEVDYTAYEKSIAQETDMYANSNPPQTESFAQNQTTPKPQSPESQTVAQGSDPNLTTSRLVGNGLAYFVFWFFGAPILTLVVFVFSMASDGGMGMFVVFLIALLIAFVYHTFQIIYSGLSASVSTDSPGKAPLVETPQTRSDDERIPCPMCAEKILRQAKICHFCKSVINPRCD